MQGYLDNYDYLDIRMIRGIGVIKIFRVIGVIKIIGVRRVVSAIRAFRVIGSGRARLSCTLMRTASHSCSSQVYGLLNTSG
jgi:hypothetical protein